MDSPRHERHGDRDGGRTSLRPTRRHPHLGRRVQEGYRVEPANQERLSCPDHQHDYAIDPLTYSSRSDFRTMTICWSPRRGVAVRARQLSNSFVYAERPYAQRDLRVVRKRRHQLMTTGAEFTPGDCPARRDERTARPSVLAITVARTADIGLPPGSARREGIGESCGATQ